MYHQKYKQELMKLMRITENADFRKYPLSDHICLVVLNSEEIIFLPLCIQPTRTLYILLLHKIVHL